MKQYTVNDINRHLDTKYSALSDSDVEKRLRELRCPATRQKLAHQWGETDSYYGRLANPNIWVGGKPYGTHIEAIDMTPEEIAAYNKGHAENDDFKDWG